MDKPKSNFRRRGNLSMYVSPKCKNYSELDFGKRVQVVQNKLPGFCPTGVKLEKPNDFTKEWWDGLTGDEQTAAFWTAMFPDRTQPGWSNETAAPYVDFYAEVGECNWEGWYHYCPAHLRKSIDNAVAKLPAAEDASPTSNLYLEVEKRWGARPSLRHDEDVEHSAWLEEWIHTYETLQRKQVVLDMAPGIQKERKLLSSALGLSEVEEGNLPNQAEGLDPTQAATIRWVQMQGQTPLEFLVDTYKNQDAKMSDRLAAARSLMDYIHRRVPVKQELEQKTITEPKLDPTILKGLSAKELEVLEKLLQKMSGA